MVQQSGTYVSGSIDTIDTHLGLLLSGSNQTSDDFQMRC
jgi:hypothetical protein